MSLDAIASVEARIRSIESRFPASAQPSAFSDALAAASTGDDGPITSGAGNGSSGTMSFSTVATASLLGPAFAAAPASVAAPQVAPPASDAWVAELPAAGQEWAPAITQAARRHGVEPQLLAALVWQESGFRPDARSHAGAIGLAQLMPGTAAGLGVDPHDPLQNLDGGARYLAEQLDRFGSTELALAAYNAGPGRVQDAGGIPDITETRNYVARVTDFHARLGGRS